MYEGGVHVPFVVHGPAVVEGGRSVDAIIDVSDVFATVLALAGVDVATLDADVTIDGANGDGASADLTAIGTATTGFIDIRAVDDVIIFGGLADSVEISIGDPAAGLGLYIYADSDGTLNDNVDAGADLDSTGGNVIIGTDAFGTAAEDGNVSLDLNRIGNVAGIPAGVVFIAGEDVFVENATAVDIDGDSFTDTAPILSLIHI